MIFPKSKFPKLSALAEKKAADITAEDITAANEELKAAGISAVVVVGSEELSQAQGLAAANEQLTSQLATATSQVTALTTQVSTLQTEVSTLTTSRDEWKGKAEKYGTQPGATGSTPVKKDGDKIESTSADEYQKTIDELPHNKALANNPLFN